MVTDNWNRYVEGFATPTRTFIECFLVYVFTTSFQHAKIDQYH